MRHHVLLLAALAAACGTADEPADEIAETTEPAALTATATADEAAALATIEQIAARYATADAAVADGFMRDPTGMCVTADMVGLPAAEGGMGVHYLHPARLGLIPESMPIDGADGAIDFAAPEVLVYEPQADGSEQLVAVEYLVFQEAWSAAGNEDPPHFFDTEFVSMVDDPATEMDEAHGLAPHHELHVWVPRSNDRGLFAAFNPAVSCAHAPMATMD
jgi:hypothetical protein